MSYIYLTIAWLLIIIGGYVITSLVCQHTMWAFDKNGVELAKTYAIRAILAIVIGVFIIIITP
jgi:hypothetical protein